MHINMWVQYCTRYSGQNAESVKPLDVIICIVLTNEKNVNSTGLTNSMLTGLPNHLSFNTTMSGRIQDETIPRLQL